MARASSEETSETDEGRQRTPLTMIIPPAVLALAAIAVGLQPHLGAMVQTAAVRFQDQHACNAALLSGVHLAHPVSPQAAESTAVTQADVLSSAGSAAGGLLLAALARTGGASRCFAAAPGPIWCWPAQSGGSRAGSSTTTSPSS